MTQLLGWLFLLILTVANWIAVFVWGFGVDVKNWWVVIGCGVFATVVLRSIGDAMKKEEKKDS